jgi:hypothetical protein
MSLKKVPRLYPLRKFDVLKTGPKEDLNGPRQLKVLKKNRGKYPKPLSIQYKDSPTNPDVAVLSYGPIELFERYPETLTEKCATWLIELLEEHGPTAFTEIQALAAQEDFRYWVLREARQLLETKSSTRWAPNGAATNGL